VGQYLQWPSVCRSFCAMAAIGLESLVCGGAVDVR
jgi:hypothetical protein